MIVKDSFDNGLHITEFRNCPSFLVLGTRTGQGQVISKSMLKSYATHRKDQTHVTCLVSSVDFREVSTGEVFNLDASYSNLSINVDLNRSRIESCQGTLLTVSSGTPRVHECI